MKINIIGDGSFGTFLKKELPNYGFEICIYSSSVIFAVPFHAYDEVARSCSIRSDIKDWHFINVCSIQQPSTDILLKYTDKVTSIHPLFGARTPVDKRNSILTYWDDNEDTCEFLELFGNFSKILEIDPETGSFYDIESHDRLMAKTHAAAVLAAKQAKHFVDAAADIPDELIPNSFRLLREFVKTLDDMPSGTVESIMANPYI